MQRLKARSQHRAFRQLVRSWSAVEDLIYKDTCPGSASALPGRVFAWQFGDREVSPVYFEDSMKVGNKVEMSPIYGTTLLIRWAHTEARRSETGYLISTDRRKEGFAGKANPAKVWSFSATDRFSWERCCLGRPRCGSSAMPWTRSLPRSGRTRW